MIQRIVSLLLFMAMVVAIASGQERTVVIQLSAPDTLGGMPLMQVFKERKSTRAFDEKKSLSDTTLADLLWAAFGVNRADGKRTAPSARNRQEISLYLCMKNGVFVYNAPEHSLTQVSPEDLSMQAGMQEYVAQAPLNIIYVADMSQANASSAEETSFYLGADCGFIAENVYLYCASAGLATVVRGSVDRASLGQALKLSPNQRILLAQTVGHGKD